MSTFEQRVEQVEQLKEQFLSSNPGWMVLAVKNDPALEKYVTDADVIRSDEESPKKYSSETSVKALFKNDDAYRKCRSEILTYPGLTAVASHMQAKALYDKGDMAEARAIAETAHTLSGIDIHPGASVDPFIFIDHGTGTVIGETASVAEGTQMYHGVTLGNLAARNIDVTDKVTGHSKPARHPQIGKNVKISLGSQILGPNDIGDNVKVGPRVLIMNSKVGAGASIGPGVRLVNDYVPENASVYASGSEVTNIPYSGAMSSGDKAAIKDFRRMKTLDMKHVRALYDSVMDKTAGRFAQAEL